jgi:short-subunit dehydrogenase
MGWALVTGASGGIGQAMCEVLARNGHDIIAVARNEEKLRELANDLHQRYGTALVTHAIDLSEKDAAAALHDATEKAGMDVDVLVNDAGFGDHAAFLDSDWERQYRMVQLDVTALMQLTHLYGNDMRARHAGRVLNLSSVAAFSAGPYMPVYYASKGFVLQFSMAVSHEIKGTGVTVTALCPGPTSTGFESAAKMKGSKMFALFRPQTAASVAKRGYRAMMAGRAVAYHSAATRLMNVGSRVAPRSTATWFAERVNGIPRERGLS